MACTVHATPNGGCPDCPDVPCSKCGEESASNEQGRCRDCEIEYLFETWPRCPTCNVRLYSDAAKSIGCSEPHAEDCDRSET